MLALWQLLWSNVLAAAVLAVLAAGLAALFRRPALTHGLWLLVLLKLVTPPLVPVTVIVSAPTTATEVRAEPDPGPAAEAEGPEEEEADPGIVAPLEMFGLPDAPRPAGDPNRADPQPPAEEAAADPDDVSIPWIPMLVGLWLASSLAWFTVAGLRVRRFQRLLRHARAAEPALQSQVHELARRLGLRQGPPVLLVEGCVSPMVWMVGGRPRLLLPAGLLGRLTEDQRATLLLHELAHLRRGDVWVRWLEMGVTGLYWWLPLLWWARRELRQAEEECCDAWVVRALPGAARAYARALVETVDFLSGAPPALPALASGVGPVHLLRRRLTMILRGTTSPKLTAFGLAALLATGALVPLLPSWAQSPAEPAPTQRGAGERKRDERDLQQAERQVQQAERALKSVRDAQQKLHDKMTKYERQMQDAMNRLNDARNKAAQAERAQPKPPAAETPMRGGAFGSGKGGAMSGAAGSKNVEQRLRDVERKLDAVLRELQQMRGELKRGGARGGSGGGGFGGQGGAGGFGGGRGGPGAGNNPFGGAGTPPGMPGFGGGRFGPGGGNNPFGGPAAPNAPNPPVPPREPGDAPNPPTPPGNLRSGN